MRFRASPRAGFTLVEVLLALALSGVLIASVVASLDLYRRMSTAGRRDVERARLARALFDRINDDVRAVTFRPPEDEAAAASDGEQAAAEEGTASADESATVEEEPIEVVVDPDAEYANAGIGIVGNALAVVIHAHQPERSEVTAEFTLQELIQLGGRTSDQRSVTYFVAQQGAVGLPGVAAESLISRMTLEQQRRLDAREPLGLVRLEGDRYALSLADDTTNLDAMVEGAQLLAPEVKWITFRYFDGTLWWTEWDTAAYGMLPRAVEVTLGIRIDELVREEETLRPTLPDAPVANTIAHRFVIALPQADVLALEAVE